MHIQIDGIYLPNKGDELMLHAIVHHFATAATAVPVHLV